MRKKLIISILILLMIILVAFIFLRFNKGEKLDESEYMIEILLRNKTNQAIESVDFGITLDGKDDILESVKYQKDTDFRFLVGYNKNTTFFFNIYSDEYADVETYYFNLLDKTNTQKPQQVLFYIEEIDNKLEIKEAP
ncbi:hypothetical protein [Anaerotignum propionicum]|uniref:hypothetical protein n=1 Tax=Anaerotignum propionicum TaxID=28446 RepID=UPI00210E48F7|nr:hypothetical protein [Anaerotignum propionicum]MCQ4935553.1 hypothetical protein [Anaerotignum propionicum]